MARLAPRINHPPVSSKGLDAAVAERLRERVRDEMYAMRNAHIGRDGKIVFPVRPPQKTGRLYGAR